MTTADPSDVFLAAYGERDWERLRALFAPDCVWTMPGTGSLSGSVHGPDQLTDRARQIADHGVSTEFLHRLQGAAGTAFLLRNTAGSGDRILDEHVATVLRVDGGLITRIDTYLSDVALKDAFFG